MKYICLVYQDEKRLAALPQGELDAIVGRCGAWVGELEEDGHHVFSAGLQSVRTATTLRNRNGRLSMTDGPFAETKECLGGLTILSARDLNEAIQLASRLAAASGASIELRPLLELDVELTEVVDQKIGAAIRRGSEQAGP